jgi:hypothetical protein
LQHGCASHDLLFSSSTKMFKEELCALSPLSSTIDYVICFHSRLMICISKKWFEAILLFKFFQLWIVRAQIFSILGEKNSLKINNFKINSNDEDNQNYKYIVNRMVINFTIMKIFHLKF